VVMRGRDKGVGLREAQRHCRQVSVVVIAMTTRRARALLNADPLGTD
jgi:hypothetical protein